MTSAAPFHLDHAPTVTTTSPPPPRKVRFALVDGLRVFAAFMVLMYHYTAYGGYPVWGKPVAQVFPQLWHVTAYGALGVQLFFIISGFVILMSCWGRTLPQFVASRISRLYPAYWCAVALAALLMLVIWPRPKTVNAHDVLVNLTMFQHPYGVLDIDGVYWTLWVELVFYFLMGLLLVMGITANRIMALAGLWPIIGTLAAHSHSTLLVAVLEPSYAPLFAGGMLIYLISRTGHSLLPWLLLGLNVILSAHETQLSTFVTIKRKTHHTLPVAACWLLILAFFLIVIAATLTPARNIRWKWLSTAGILTYPLYLTHQYWGLWLIERLHTTLAPYVTLTVTIVAVVALAWTIHQLVERPFHRPMRRAIEKSLARVSVAPPTPAP